MALPLVLGLDIGGANIKAATSDGRAVSVPFALWKQPDQLPTVLASIIARFEEITSLAITMTGEMCDCFANRREGVNAILDAVSAVAHDKPVQVWGVDGQFHAIALARDAYMTVAAANWHATATFVGRFVPTGPALLLDIGSTTTDIISLQHGKPATVSKTDKERMTNSELLYRGVKRTPVFVVNTEFPTTAEFFATTHDVFVVLGKICEDVTDLETADGRPRTRDYSLARLARQIGTDRGLFPDKVMTQYATAVKDNLAEEIASAMDAVLEVLSLGCIEDTVLICCGMGEFLCRDVIAHVEGVFNREIFLTDKLSPMISPSAPAYAVAVLAAERQS